MIGLPDGMPCSHPGCLNHISHPCEGCGRIGGMTISEGKHYYEPLEEHTYPTYGGITRGDHPTIKGFEVPGEVGHITPKLINDFFSRLATRREIQATKAMLKEGKNGE